MSSHITTEVKSTGKKVQINEPMQTPIRKEMSSSSSGSYLLGTIVQDSTPTEGSDLTPKGFNNRLLMSPAAKFGHSNSMRIKNKDDIVDAAPN
jgi:hypothetical protein